MEWPNPENLGHELPAVPILDLNLLPVTLLPMVEDVADRMQVPIDFPAVASMATLSGPCCRRAQIQPKANDTSWVVPPNLQGGLVGPPGIMKTLAIAATTAPARALEERWRTENDMAKRER
jgi:putative DNA primase/helicase